MKWQYLAIDENGRPIQGVLEAETEQAARLALLEAAIFAKKCSPADEDAKLTWKPQSAAVSRLKQRLVEGKKNMESTPLMSFPVTAALSADREKFHLSLFANRIEFLSLDVDESPALVIAQGELEQSRLTGSLTKYWELTTTAGRTISMEAGTVLVRREIREANDVLQSWVSE